MNSAVIIWLIIAVVLGVLESMTSVLVSIWMAVGAVASAIAAAMGYSLMTQILIFLVVSALLLVLTVPLTKQFRNREKESTNADRLIGQEAVVIADIDTIENKGQIKVLGQIWSASSADGTAIEKNEKVIVKAIEGVHVIVEKR